VKVFSGMSTTNGALFAERLYMQKAREKAKERPQFMENTFQAKFLI